MAIHSTAIVDRSAELDTSVHVGPYSIIGPGCRIAENTTIGPHCHLKENVILGRNNSIAGHSSLGVDPQDLKYGGETTALIIGDHNDIREYATLSRGTFCAGRDHQATIIGNHNVIMSYAHVAHDAILHDGIVMANAATLAGHTEIFSRAILGGLAAVHQFARIGEFAFVGGGSMVVKDVPPYHLANGNRAKICGLNLIGLQRNGFSKQTIATLKRAHRLLFHGDQNLSQAVDQLRSQAKSCSHTARLVQFIDQSQRGVCL